MHSRPSVHGAHLHSGRLGALWIQRVQQVPQRDHSVGLHLRQGQRWDSMHMRDVDVGGWDSPDPECTESWLSGTSGACTAERVQRAEQVPQRDHSVALHLRLGQRRGRPNTHAAET